MSVTIITKRWYAGGVLVDPTSMELSDPTGLFGVRRQDTLAVVVADGTAMTKISVGVYQHTFTDPAYDLTYEYWVETVYGGETTQVEFLQAGSTTPGVTPIGVGTLIGQVRLYIGDLYRAILEEDDYIQVFLTRNGDDVLLAAADACAAIAADAALLDKAETIGNYELDRKGIIKKYLALADHYRSTIYAEPAFGFFEQSHSDMSARDIIDREAMRDG